MVTFTGGSQSGWIRAILYLNNVEVARSTGPSHTGGGAGFPIIFTTTAPTSGGPYTYQAAWYGNRYDTSSLPATFTPDPNNANHGEQRVSTNSFTISAPAAPTISTASLSAGTVGTAYSQTLAATGGTTPYSWSLSAGTLPAGLSLSAAGVLGGTPTAAGTSSFTIQVTGANSASSTKAFSVTISAATTGAVTVTPTDGATDVPVNTVITARVGSGDIRTIFNNDTFTLKPSVGTGDSSVGPAGPMKASVCVSGGIVQGSFAYNSINTLATFTPNCDLDHGKTYIGTVASGGTGTAAGAAPNPQSWRFTTIPEGPDSDGDGVQDAEDDDPHDGKKATPPSSKGTGKFHIEVTGSSGTLLTEALGISDTNSRLTTTGKPEGYEFRDGLASFKVVGVDPGSTVTVVVTFPSDIPAGSKAYMVDSNGFHEVVGAVVNGNAVTMTLTDGGQGDSDGQVNGIIVDPVGVASPASPGSGSIDLTTGGSSGGGCTVAVRTGSGGSDIDGALILAGMGLTVWGIRIKRRRG